MADHPGDIRLADGVSAFLLSMKSGQEDAQQYLAKFVRWFGHDRRVAAITPAELEDFAGQAGSSSEGDARPLKPVREFLAYAKKNGIFTENLAVHLKVRRSARRSRSSKGLRAASDGPAQLTKEGYDQLKSRLAWLTEEMVGTAGEIRRAAADKDVRENAPLEAAREYLGQLDAQRRGIEEVLTTAQVIQDDGARSSTARQGRKVTLEEVGGEQQTWILVDAREAAPLEGKLSTSSPVGKAILGRSVGEEVDVATPRGGSLRYRVIDVG